jgi:elongation factor 1-alpha
MSAGKEHLSLVVCGHVDAGKSTTCGHLIFKLGGISEREMAKLQAEADEKGKSSFGFAYYLDTCKEERERGVTIQCNTKEFFTEKYHYTIVDAPGHKDYIKNMITGSATADVGMLLVPAEKGGFESAIAKADPKLGVEEGQTRQHARLLYLLGVEQIIVSHSDSFAIASGHSCRPFVQSCTFQRSASFLTRFSQNLFIPRSA